MTWVSNYDFNHNYNNILESDWLSAAVIWALIGQCTRHAWCNWTVRVICERCN